MKIKLWCQWPKEKPIKYYFNLCKKYTSIGFKQKTKKIGQLFDNLVFFKVIKCILYDGKWQRQ